MAKIVREKVAETSAEENYAEEEYDAPSTSVNRSTNISSGWGAPRQERRETVKAPFIDFKKGDSSKLVAILNAEPTAHWKRHYVKSLNKMFYCYHETGCPLCDVGHRSSWVYRINVVELNDNDSEVRVWDFGWNAAQSLQAMSAKKPINADNRYFDLTHVKGSGVTIIPVVSAQLEDEYDIMPLDPEVRAELEAKSFGESSVFINSFDQVQQAARRIDPDQDFDRD